MSRKHNTRHERALSRYPQRLAKRGVTTVEVRMTDLPTLRHRQGYREPEQGDAYR